jgi:pimeloyl-ACP methyl ester carboxylesterase
MDVNGISLHVTEAGEGPLVVLVHGFPELGYSWRHQVSALAEAGYRVIAPDMRGYGGSSRPREIAAYDIDTLAEDLTGLLDAVGAQDAVFVGHDWGAMVVWHLALSCPDRVRAVAGMSVPPSPRPPVSPVTILRNRLGEDFYIVWFQEPGVADAVLNANVRATLLSDDLRISSGRPPRTRPWLTEDELQVYIDTFERTGFTGGLNYYRNIDRNWELTAPLAGATIDCPSMFLTGSKDPVSLFMPADKITQVLTDLRGHIVLDGAGHWVQQERPAEVNDALVGFLASLP